MDVKELIGVTLGTCTLERIIGRGGMGAVFLAQQSRPIRIVAVKVLLPASGADAEERRVFLERFRREADTVAKLEQKNILPIFEYDEAVVHGQQLAYLVMPYIRGGTLRERIDEMNREGRRFDLQTISDYIGQVAEALSYAHSLGVVHRDVKPANLLIHSDGRLLLSDFGIVRLNAMPALTTAGNFLGTAEYASPEQSSAGPLDARSDIYSLGIILYELLTGHVPFTAQNPFAVLAKHMNEPLPPIRQARPDLSPAIEFVVKKALAKNAQDRYQSALEMAADLRAAISPALAVPGMLRLTGSAGNGDVTEPDHPWRSQGGLQGGAGIAGIAGVAAPVQQAAQQVASAIPPTSPAVPIPPPASPPPSPFAFQIEADQIASPAQKRAWNRRLYFYGATVLAVLAQLLVLGLLFTPASPAAPGNAAPSILGILAGSSVNMLALAALVFTGVTRDRSLRKSFLICLAVTLVAPLLSGFFVSYGALAAPGSRPLHVPLVSYGILLASNMLALRQLRVVDVAPDQVQTAPVLWRSTFIGALAGLLPLTMILILTLTTSSPLPTNNPLLLRILGVLLIALVGAPTPGTMLAVWLSQKMTFPTLVRSSALAGLLLFVVAFLLVVVWSLLTANHLLFFDQFKQSGLAFLVGVELLGLLGALRAMLDAWVYRRLLRRRNESSR